MICLENVLQINPKNANAKRGLDMLRKKAPPQMEKPPSKPNNPFLVEGSEWDIDGNTDFLLGSAARLHRLNLISLAPHLRHLRVI